MKLLSALFTSTDGCILGSVDVSDACLQVQQSEPTVVEIDGNYYELGYTLPVREQVRAHGSTNYKESSRSMA